MLSNCFEICVSKSRLKVDIESVCNKYGFEKWGFILHDKDTKLPHYHIYVNCGFDNLDPKYIARCFQVPLNCVSKSSSNLELVRDYMLHRNTCNSLVFQYHFSELVSNF